MHICLSLFGTTEELCTSIAESAEADLYEVRLDLSPSIDYARVRQATKKPLIFTAPAGDARLAEAAPSADYVDAGPKPQGYAKPIVSVHSGEADPDALWAAHRGDHITKIVLQTADYAKIARLIELDREHPGQALCFAMGDAGAFSRILAAFAGAPWIYASAGSRPTAPGQFTVRELIDVYRVRRFDAQPLLFGIAGDPVAHSRSPQFHNAAFAEANLPWMYVPFRCTDLPALLRHATAFGIRGLSLTHPLKESALSLVSLTNEAQQIGACNTIALVNGEWQGINTDIAGMSAVLDLQQIELSGKRVVILGAGGSARAAAAAVARGAASLTILNRTIGKAQQLASLYGAKAGWLSDFGNYPYDLLIQCTSVGLVAGECPVDPRPLHPNAVVIDAIYDPAETLLLQKARALGCRTINGESWFTAQAQAQFDWWVSHKDTKTQS